MIVAIDGPAGSGKSTIAREIAARLGFSKLDTGAMSRRVAMAAPQRAFSQGRDVVAEGRDIGSVVFPAAELKVFLTADPRERARRRVLQRHAGKDVDPAVLEAEIAQTLSDIERRDAADAGRAAAPLVCPPDAVRIDSTASTIDQIVDQISALVADRR